eukprot:908814_1
MAQPRVEESDSSASNGHRKRKSRVNKGLRHYSVKVCERLQQVGSTTYNDIASSLVNDFLIENNHSIEPGEEKNIRRRIYDALNVLCSLGIIYKDKKKIRWRGLQHTAGQATNDQYRNELNQKLELSAKKRVELCVMTMQFLALQTLVERNGNDVETLRTRKRARKPHVEEKVIDAKENGTNGQTTTLKEAAINGITSNTAEADGPHKRQKLNECEGGNSASPSVKMEVDKDRRKSAEFDSNRENSPQNSQKPSSSPEISLKSEKDPSETLLDHQMVSSERRCREKLHLPFILINANPRTDVSCEEIEHQLQGTPTSAARNTNFSCREHQLSPKKQKLHGSNQKN